MGTGEGDGLALAVGAGEGEGAGEAVGFGEGVGASVITGCGADGCGTGVTSGAEVAPSSGDVPRF